MKRVRIAHSEGRDWKTEIDDYLLMYRSTFHTTTGISPAELLFGRKLRTKLPQLQDYVHNDTEVRDREQKEKRKLYIDEKRGAKKNYISKGDSVLLKQARDNKFSTPFNAKPYNVIEKHGNSDWRERGCTI